MKYFFAAAIFTMAASNANAQLAFPGYTWGTITFPNSILKNSGKEQENAALDVKVEQGIDWARLGDGFWIVNTYVHVRLVTDNQGLDWNNKLSPAIGVKLRRSMEGGIVDIGAQVVQERRWKSDVKSSGVQAYASWWFGWGGAKQSSSN